MRMTMTSTIAQLGLAAAAALAIAFPTPKDVLESLSGTDDADFYLANTETDPANLVGPTAQKIERTVRMPGCAGSATQSIEVLHGCSADLARQLVNISGHEEANNTSVFRVSEDFGTGPRFDMIQSALVEVCRAQWVVSGGDMGAVDTTSCGLVVDGLAE